MPEEPGSVTGAVEPMEPGEPGGSVTGALEPTEPGEPGGSVTGAVEPGKLDDVEELWQYEEERRRRRELINRISWKIVAVFMALAFGLLAYDSGSAAIAIHDHRVPPPAKGVRFGYEHQSWQYAAVVAVVSGLTALTIVVLALKRRRRRGTRRWLE
jgi:hypothetical protein